MSVTQELWTDVDRYITDRLVPHDEALRSALAASDAAGLPPIQVSPSQGKLLHLFARMQNARRILEIGTLGGYSTIWMARALPPDGRLVSLEADPKHAEVARANVAKAGLDRIVEIRIGRALDTLPRLAADSLGPFDLIFIDADKPNIPQYLEWALRLSRRGSLIVVDNMIREGKIIDTKGDDASVSGVRRCMEMLGADRRLTATALQTVGSKGYDGFALALVTGEL
jgi:predicted O-methyltransferase YrrM